MASIGNLSHVNLSDSAYATRPK